MSIYRSFSEAETRTTSDGRTIMAFPVTRQPYTHALVSQQTKLRVAAYARVSTDQEEQLNSYEAQIDHYTHFIQSHTEWEFAGMYADEGISATSMAHREGFQRMITDALAGKIDRIITKSVSRFARNTVDSLTTIRKLKEKGIGVTFEKENIDTLDSKGELLITLMSSLAQEESRSMSENVTWGQRKRFADGKVSMSYRHFLGYDKGQDHMPVINKKEAKTVRWIYQSFLDGMSASAIAKELMRQEIPSPGGSSKWATTTVLSILQNEKYMGDALLQKSFTLDFLTKKTKKNEGEVPQYYVKNSHPAIVSREVFEMVQYELKRRKEHKVRICSDSPFAGKIICGDCGGYFGSKVWNSTNQYRRIIWQCNHKYGKSGAQCRTPHIKDEEIQRAFAYMLEQAIEQKEVIFSFYDELIARLTDVAEMETKKQETQIAGMKVRDEIVAWINENAHRAIDQEIYTARYDELAAKLESLNHQIETLDESIQERKIKRYRAERIMQVFQQFDPAHAFDAGLFNAMVEVITVFLDRFVFRLRDETEYVVTRDTKSW